jgi:phosphoadenosine phosphosulfate reductase
MIDPGAVIAEALASATTPCVTSSFQAEDVALVHMLRASRPDIPVLFLETFHHFADTLTYRDELARAWHLNLVSLKAAEPQIGLWRTDTTACCARHKVGPLFAALEGYDVWFTWGRQTGG